MDLDDKPIYSDGGEGVSACSVHRNGWSLWPSEMCSLLITATGHLVGVRTFAPRQLNPHCSSPSTSLYFPPLALNANNMAKPSLGKRSKNSHGLSSSANNIESNVLVFFTQKLTYLMSNKMSSLNRSKENILDKPVAQLCCFNLPR